MPVSLSTLFLTPIFIVFNPYNIFLYLKYRYPLLPTLPNIQVLSNSTLDYRGLDYEYDMRSFASFFEYFVDQLDTLLEDWSVYINK